MLGFPSAACHLELVDSADLPPAPTAEDLLVLYLGTEPDADLLDRLVAAGGARVESRNPYWDARGVTIVDPDSYRPVLCSRQWP